MDFINIFVPIFFGVIAASLVIEVAHFLLELWMSRRQHARVKEYYKEIANKMGISVEELMSQMGNGMMGGMPPGMDMMGGGGPEPIMTTASGSSQHEGQGQYL